MRARIALAVLLLIGLVLAATSATGRTRAGRTGSAYKKTALVRIESTLRLNLPPDKVWQSLTSADGFCALAGFTAQETGKRLEHPGDLTRASIWGDQGTLVCTLANPFKELRVTWEPQNGSYLCHKLVTLQPATGGTILHLVDRYTDDQMKTVDKTAREVAAQGPKDLAAFKAFAEKP